MVSGFVLPDSTKLKLSELELPVERARLRQIWKACDKAENGAATKTLPAVPVASGSEQSKQSAQGSAGGLLADADCPVPGCEDPRRSSSGAADPCGGLLARVLHEIKSET